MLKDLMTDCRKHSTYYLEGWLLDGMVGEIFLSWGGSCGRSGTMMTVIMGPRQQS